MHFLFLGVTDLIQRENAEPARNAASMDVARVKVRVRGAVQGVGFRPFVFRLARALGLAGWVNNSSAGVLIEAEGGKPALHEFLLRLEADKPPRSFIQSLEATWLDPAGYADFTIRDSDESGARSALVLPDIATCADCRREIFDPNNRRYRYPFTNCTHCGPRFSIIEGLPYDRAKTSMKRFTMCAACQAEYDNPHDRRFHAQPNACARCGPHLELWDRAGKRMEYGDAALLGAVAAVKEGHILAVKGLGGFQLLVAGHQEEAVLRLRTRKQREEKPFALMFASLAQVKPHCAVDEMEQRLLLSPEAPIVLLRKAAAQLTDTIAPGNPYHGVMLPYTPLHHLLMSELAAPVVATSGNLSDEPICLDEHEALERLGGIADVFLVHNRPIVRQVDDSVARVMMERELVLRRARGYAPLPIALSGVCTLSKTLSETSSISAALSIRVSDQDSESGVLGQSLTTSYPPMKRGNILAVGAQLKNTVALSVGPQVFVSQHIGDLEAEQAFGAFQRVITDLQELYEPAGMLAADLHPDYASTRFAQQSGLPVVQVQHHYAHVLACMAENELTPPVLGVAWDGTGYGTDGTIWGGEFLLITETGFERVAWLRPFRLPGGDQAIKEPRRSALGLLYEMTGEAALGLSEIAAIRAFTPQELALLKTMLQRQLNAPWTSSAGRLFDGVAALIGLRQETRHEGQAAMELEFRAEEAPTEETYPLPMVEALAGLVLDWAPMVREILADRKQGLDTGLIAAKFHHSLAAAIVGIARRADVPKVALSGGCFQNRRLTELVVQRLAASGYRPYWHQRIPPNDGGIALGQVMAAMRVREQVAHVFGNSR